MDARDSSRFKRILFSAGAAARLGRRRPGGWAIRPMARIGDVLDRAGNPELPHDPRSDLRRRRPDRRSRLTLALLVAAALATTEAPADQAAPATTRPVEQTQVEQAQQNTPPAEDQAEAHGGLLAVPLKLLSVLDQDFSLGPWTFRGYIQFDGANYTQPAAGPPETDFRRGAIGSGDTLDARALADGSYLRKARLGGEGQWGENLSYRAMFDIGGRDEQGEARIAEVWARYSRFAPWVIIAGAYPQLANMEDATSTDANPFLERATAANLARGLGGGDGRLGITVRRATRNWMTAVSLTGPVLHEDDETSPKSAVVVRTSRAFYPSAESSYHLGGSLIYVLSPGDPQDGRTPGFGVRLQATPEVRVDDTPLLDTGDIAAHHVRVLGVEFAARRRNLFLQAEAFHFAVERSSKDLPRDPRFFGFYVEGSWMLTGEARRFDQTRAVFGRPLTRNPLRAGGWGAWELAARYSRMDANSYAGDPGAPPPPGGVRGGDQTILSLALNWYPSDRIRVMLNAMHVRVDRLNPAAPLDPEPFGPAPSTPPVGVQIGQSLDVMAMRVRYAF